jgi:hypothetical protein
MAEVAGAVGNIAVNTQTIDPNSNLGKAVMAYNLGMAVIGVKNLAVGGYKFVVALPENTKNLLQQSKGLRLLLKERYVEWQSARTAANNLTLEEKTLLDQQEKVWKALGIVDDLENINITLKKLINKFSSENIQWRNLDDKNIIWASSNSNMLSTAKSFANEIGNSLYDIVLQNGYYAKIDINDGRILLGNTDGSYYAFAVINDAELGTFKSSTFNAIEKWYQLKPEIFKN